MAIQRRAGRKRRKVDILQSYTIEHIDFKDLDLLKTIYLWKR